MYTELDCRLSNPGVGRPKCQIRSRLVVLSPLNSERFSCVSLQHQSIPGGLPPLWRRARRRSQSLTFTTGKQSMSTHLLTIKDLHTVHEAFAKAPSAVNAGSRHRKLISQQLAGVFLRSLPTPSAQSGGLSSHPPSTVKCTRRHAATA